MYREDVENYPKKYAKSNVDQIIDTIDLSRSLSIFAPSGFGKSSLSKYIAFNQSYRNRYYKLKRVNFVYVNLSELSAETFEESQAMFSPVDNNKQKRFIEILYRSFLETDRTKSTEQIQDKLLEFQNGDFKNNYYAFIEKYLKQNKGKLSVLILDNVEALNKPGFDGQKEFLKNFRDQYRTRIEYLFMIGDLTQLDHLNKAKWSSLIDLITQKILLMKMPVVEECILPMHVEENIIMFNLITRYSSWFKEKLKLIHQWSGGYPPYFKYLFRINNLESLKNLIVDRELELSSERLISSLDKAHLGVLMDLVKKKIFDEKSRESKELLQMGLIIKEPQGFRLFSPLLHHYLNNK
ncbi:MAG: hypothetical protein ACMG57_00805 [Candidatus Dojkabacteria bacterium]